MLVAIWLSLISAYSVDGLASIEIACSEKRFAFFDGAIGLSRFNIFHSYIHRFGGESIVVA
jgi:hypothetical protein